MVAILNMSANHTDSSEAMDSAVSSSNESATGIIIAIILGILVGVGLLYCIGSSINQRYKLSAKWKATRNAQKAKEDLKSKGAGTDIERADALPSYEQAMREAADTPPFVSEGQMTEVTGDDGRNTLIPGSPDIQLVNMNETLSSKEEELVRKVQALRSQLLDSISRQLLEMQFNREERIPLRGEV